MVRQDHEATPRREHHVISFRVDGVPETKGSWKSVGRGRFIPDNPREPIWAQLVGWHAKQAMQMHHARTDYARREMLGGALEVDLTFVLPPPHGRKNRRDVDKLIRSVLDAMQGIVYADDEQIAEVAARKLVQPSGHGVRIRVAVWEPPTN